MMVDTPIQAIAATCLRLLQKSYLIFLRARGQTRSFVARRLCVAIGGDSGTTPSKSTSHPKCTTYILYLVPGILSIILLCSLLLPILYVPFLARSHCRGSCLSRWRDPSGYLEWSAPVLLLLVRFWGIWNGQLACCCFLYDFRLYRSPQNPYPKLSGTMYLHDHIIGTRRSYCRVPTGPRFNLLSWRRCPREMLNLVNYPECN